MSYQSDDDLQLITRIKDRDEDALSRLYTEYGSRVYGVALYILKDPTLAEEAAQDTFLKVWDSAHRWNSHQSKLSTWILTIARFAAIDIVRREHRHAGNSSIDDTDDYLFAVLDDAAHQDNARLLQSLMTSLPAEQFQAIELAFFRGMTHQEIAARLSQPLGTVKSRVRLGLQYLHGLWLLNTR
jgi:RNA polymerase sigma-70 factor (ECF subfamily)